MDELRALERYEILRTSEEARALEYAMCAQDPEFFIFNDQQYVKTKDEHDIEHPVKALPGTEYERYLIKKIHKHSIICIPKSRQLRVTWLMCSYILWDFLFRPFRLNIVQSKKEDDAANLVFVKQWDTARISFMLRRVPSWLKIYNGKPLKFSGSFCKILATNGSQIWGIPQGGDVVRSNTASILFDDEAAFQPEFEDAYTAAQPMVKGGGKHIIVSSADPSYMEQLIDVARFGIRGAPGATV